MSCSKGSTTEPRGDGWQQHCTSKSLGCPRQGNEKEAPTPRAPQPMADTPWDAPTCSASRSWISRVLCISSCCCLRRCSSSCSRISACLWASLSSSSSCSFLSFSSCSCLSRCVSSSLAALRCSRCSRCSRRFCFRSLCRDFFPSACSRMAVWMAGEGGHGQWGHAGGMGKLGKGCEVGTDQASTPGAAGCQRRSSRRCGTKSSHRTCTSSHPCLATPAGR